MRCVGTSEPLSSRGAQQRWPGTAAEKFSASIRKGIQMERRRRVRGLEGLEEAPSPCLLQELGEGHGASSQHRPGLLGVGGLVSVRPAAGNHEPVQPHWTCLRAPLIGMGRLSSCWCPVTRDA